MLFEVTTSRRPDRRTTYASGECIDCRDRIEVEVPDHEDILSQIERAHDCPVARAKLLSAIFYVPTYS